MHVVVFLGAGFSAAFGLPVMNEFFRSAQQSAILTDKEKRFIREIRESARNAMGTIRISDTNLEDVLSFETTGERSKITEDGNSNSISVETILAKIYGTQPRDWNELQFRNMFNTLFALADWIDQRQLTVITTNYDVTAEFGFLTCGIPLRLPFEHSTTTASSLSLYSHVPTSPILCKIHGSANWFETANGIQVEDGIVNGFRLRDDRETESIYWPKISDKDFQLPMPPVIVPPTVFKAHGPEPITTSLAKAREALAIADRVVFIGYSFPDSDAYMRYFLANALARNLEFDKILILDPHAETIVKKLTNQTTGYGELIVNKLTARSRKWQDYHGSVFDDLD